MFNYQQNPNIIGYAAPNRPQPRYTQPVTNEMSKMLLSNEDKLSVKISPTEKIKNMCTHKFPGTDRIALVYTGNEDDPTAVTCQVCGESFHMIMEPSKEIGEAVEKVLDILQSAKTMYLDMPEEFATEYFQIMTLLGRIPVLFNEAAKNFNMYDQFQTNPNPIWGNNNSFQQINGIIGGYNMGGIQPGFYGGWAPVQPQPVYYQQPTVQYDQYGRPIMQTAPVAPAAPSMDANPLMYSAPVAPVQAPQTVQPQQAVPVAPMPQAPAPAPIQQPVMQTAPVAPAAPATQTGDITQVKSFSV